MPPCIVPVGQRYGRLTVIEERRPGDLKVQVRCDCGTTLSVRYKALGRTTNSCGCARRAHVLTNIDSEKRRADCAVCGPNNRIRPQLASDMSKGWRCRPPHEMSTYGRSSREGHARRMRRARAKRYGITMELVESLTLSQGNRCAICLQPPMKGRLSIDHCHKTNKVRSLLCTNCNAAIGMLREDPEIMRRAIAYVLQHAPP